MKQAIALTVILAATVMAGCLENGSSVETMVYGAVAPDELEPGFYQFTHRGGDLELSVPSDHYARFDLFNGDDERLGRIELGSGGFADQLSIDGAPGAYVLHLIELAVIPDHRVHETNASTEEPADDAAAEAQHAEEPQAGELTMRSAGRTVEVFRPLGLHVERHVLVDRPFQTQEENPLPGLGIDSRSGSPLDETLTVELQRTPVDVRLLVAGSAYDIRITGRGAGGLVFDSEGTYEFPYAHLEQLSRHFHPENVVDNVLEIELTANGQEGPIVLQTSGYSRFLPEDIPDVRLLEMESPDDGVVFTYGELPSMPTRIEVSKTASALQFWTEGYVPEEGMSAECETGEACSGQRDGSEPIVAWFAVFDPNDVKLGSFRVESGQRLELPVDQGGSYVLYSVSGPVTVGTDAVPRDFEMHSLELRSHEVGESSPGSADEYGRVNIDINVTGAIYQARPVMLFEQSNDLMPPLFSGCASSGSVRLLAGGETIGLAGDRVPNTFATTNRDLPATGLQLIQDGFHGNCGQVGLVVHTYHR